MPTLKKRFRCESCKSRLIIDKAKFVEVSLPRGWTHKIRVCLKCYEEVSLTAVVDTWWFNTKLPAKCLP
jgi:hypothetical protein